MPDVQGTGLMTTVIVTEIEYRKAESTFVNTPRMSFVSAPKEEDALAAAIRETGARGVIVGPRPYTGALYRALPPGGVLARFGVGHDGIDKTKATAVGILCTN